MSTAREGQHVHLISKMKYKEGSLFPQNSDYPPTKLLYLGSKPQSIKIHSASQLLNLQRQPIIRKSSICSIQVHNLVFQ